MSMKKRQLLIQRTAIDGFCYAFAEALLEKLKELKKEGRIVEANTAFTDIGVIVFTALGNQLGYDCGGDVDKLIDAAEEFLAIFQKK